MATWAAGYNTGGLHHDSTLRVPIAPLYLSPGCAVSSILLVASETWTSGRPQPETWALSSAVSSPCGPRKGRRSRCPSRENPR